MLILTSHGNTTNATTLWDYSYKRIVDTQGTGFDLGVLDVVSNNAEPRIKRLAEKVEAVCAVDSQERFLITRRWNSIRVRDLRTGYLVLNKWFHEFSFFPEKAQFDVTGEFACVGGRWGGGVVLLRTSDWSLLYTNEATAIDAVLDTDSESKGWFVLSGHPSQHRVTCFDLEPFKKRWEIGLCCSPGPIIPWGEKPPARKYWAKTWYGDFFCLDGATGSLLFEQNCWNGLGPSSITSPLDSDIVAMTTHSGDVQICWKDDFDRILDPDFLPFKADEVAFNSDASFLAILRQDRLYLMETARWRQNALRATNLQRLFGNSLATRKAMTTQPALTADPD